MAPVLDVQIFTPPPIIKYIVTDTHVDWNSFKDLIKQIKKISLTNASKIFSALGVEEAKGGNLLTESPHGHVGFQLSTNSCYTPIKKGIIPETAQNIVYECLRKQFSFLDMVHYIASKPEIYKDNTNLWLGLKVYREREIKL